jgi:2,3-bisphosphoglycerate-independent phosphoglycerate mutase
LARGIDAYQHYPSIQDRFGLRGQAVARYPMYSGVAKLVGMVAAPPAATDAGSVDALAQRYNDYDFHFLHFKAIDSRGEDGDFAAKAAAIEAVDELLPRIVSLQPAALIVTGDHSTPAALRAHSWHPVPILIASAWCRWAADATFGETACRAGDLGVFPAQHIMTLALAHAGRLMKYGA